MIEPFLPTYCNCQALVNEMTLVLVCNRLKGQISLILDTNTQNSRFPMSVCLCCKKFGVFFRTEGLYEKLAGKSTKLKRREKWFTTNFGNKLGWGTISTQKLVLKEENQYQIRKWGEKQELITWFFSSLKKSRPSGEKRPQNHWTCSLY